MQAAVSQRTYSKLPSRTTGTQRDRILGKMMRSHLFLPSVFTVIGDPRRDGLRKSEAGPLMVSVDFQLSVLELVAELLRAASFLVIIDQIAHLGVGHRMAGSGMR